MKSKLVLALAIVAALGLSSVSAFAQETKPAAGSEKKVTKKKKKHRKHKKHGKKKEGEPKTPS
jgi:hypothetical protein